MSAFRACVIVPTRNHVSAMDATLSFLDTYGLPAIVIDDGSDEAAGTALREICARHAGAEYQRHAFNGGKGLCGYVRYLARQRTRLHARRADRRRRTARSERPRCASGGGAAQSGRDRHRGSGIRSIHAGSTALLAAVHEFLGEGQYALFADPRRDVRFRVYPVAATLQLVRRSVKSRRMDFDVEILVKANWAGIATASVPVRVRYPEGEFLELRPAARQRAAVAIADSVVLRDAAAGAAADLSPRTGTAPGGAAAHALVEDEGARRLLGPARSCRNLFRARTFICLAAMSPVVFYFFLTAREQREASQDYLKHLWKSGYLDRRRHDGRRSGIS